MAPPRETPARSTGGAAQLIVHDSIRQTNEPAGEVGAGGVVEDLGFAVEVGAGHALPPVVCDAPSHP
jgi:hypothetical protein